jgi:predicted dehydrogenase
MPSSPIGVGGGWRQPERAKAGILYGTGLHVIDAMRFIVRREVEAVAAWTDGRTDRLDSRVLALLRFNGGLEALLVAALGPARPDNGLVLHGRTGRLVLRDTPSTRLGGALELVTAHERQCWEYADEQAAIRMYVDEFERFGQTILEGAPLDATGRDGLAALLIGDAIQQSAAEGRTVEVASPDA